MQIYKYLDILVNKTQSLCQNLKYEFCQVRLKILSVYRKTRNHFFNNQIYAGVNTKI